MPRTTSCGPATTCARRRWPNWPSLDDAGFRALFAGGPVKRIGRNRFVRNVLIAIGNSGDPALLPSAERLRSDPDPVVAEAAEWAAGAAWSDRGMALTKRSFSLAGHRTSVALEDEFWDALAAIAARREQKLSALVEAVDAERTPSEKLGLRPQNLCVALPVLTFSQAFPVHSPAAAKTAPLQERSLNGPRPCQSQNSCASQSTGLGRSNDHLGSSSATAPATASAASRLIVLAYAVSGAP